MGKILDFPSQPRYDVDDALIQEIERLEADVAALQAQVRKADAYIKGLRHESPWMFYKWLMLRLVLGCAVAAVMAGPALAITARVGVTGTLIPRTAIATSEPTATAVSVSDGVTYWN